MNGYPNLRALRDARLWARNMGRTGTDDTVEDRPDPHAPTHWVYAICNPAGTPFYVGRTNCLERRRQDHRASISELQELSERLADVFIADLENDLMIYALVLT